ncbi:hypothetical protein A2U01_0088314, partial [Trifolium medium]|nr:hypothetical protein [Trifolium medium]
SGALRRVKWRVARSSGIEEVVLWSWRVAPKAIARCAVLGGCEVGSFC